MPRFLLATISAAALLLTSCVNDVPMLRKESAQRIAMPVFMIPRTVPAGPFMLKGYERVHQKYTAATLYIEGDGVPYATPDTASLLNMNTPVDPVGLRMAAQDGDANVVWLGRPCQFEQKYMGKKDCPEKYWTTHRYAPEVIDAYNQALDNIKAYHDVTSFNIVGYNGGGAIAAILAAEREDILSLRTVAGNLDPKTASLNNNVTFLTGSLNPVDFAPQLVSKPQRHFIGKLDNVIPPTVYNSYAQALSRAGDASCLAVTLVDNADHQNGWTEQWKVLRNLPVACNVPPQEAVLPPVPFDPSTLDGDKGLGPK